MKTKFALPIIIYAIFLTACGGVTPYPMPLTVSPTFVTPTVSFLTTTSTPTLTPIPWKTPTPETLYGYPTPEIMVVPTCGIDGCMMNFTPEPQRRDITFHELYVGKYVLRNWCDSDPQVAFFTSCAVIISSKNIKQVEIWGYPAKFREETGADLTGNGKPDIVITNSSGGNCCVGTIIYEAGDKLEKIMDIGSFRTGTFTDLNGDGTYEYIVPYRLWPRICSMCDARPTVVFEYQPKLGYIPATYKFKNTLSFNFNEALSSLDKFATENPNTPFLLLSANYYSNPTAEDEEYLKFDKETNWEYSRSLNRLYNITVYYLLAGQPDDAENVLNKYLPPNKAEEYMQVVKEELKGLLPP
jgi:hypothetical protein